ncbi:hypothetical protein DVH24_024580 [Malus domestica]|uniref:Conserved oligomeric Golgi complex subunit 7 n=1 Tax=Malus domestica TaxID=3750 RepID=A0A498JIK6_MALDO|nr:hypothetical protein DVH24_024580 [Malus domestica]
MAAGAAVEVEVAFIVVIVGAAESVGVEELGSGGAGNGEWADSGDGEGLGEAEEIAASLEEQSASALLRVPRATRDVVRIRDDAVSSILDKFKKAEGSSAESMAALAKVDIVKQRMEAAYETLQDAAGLTQLSATVEDVFASGDLPLAAETLANMRHCLSAVGEVAEFANLRKQLEVLEDRLDSMVQPRLTDAISNRKAVYLPYESFKQGYGHMERAILSAEIAGVDLRGAVTRGVGAQGIELSEAVRRMEELIPQVIVLLEAAVERCISFTGGSEADELIVAIDDIMLQYISTLQETLKSLRVVCGVDHGGDTVGSKKEIGLDKDIQSARKVDSISNEEWSIVQGALQILTVADCLTSRSSVFEASLRATLARLSTTLSVSVFGSSVDQNPSHLASDDGNGFPSLGGRAALDVAAVWLIDVPEKARKLFNLLSQSKDPRFHALPLASQRVAAFADTVNELVYDVLISKVRQCFSDVSRLPIWSSVEEQSAYNLPTFSAYPQAYVTSIGEYILTLPQQLEPLTEGVSNSDTNNDEAQIFATEWMFKQLSVDIEYLSNVLSALSMPIPPVLATFHTCLSTSRDQLKDLVKSDAGNLDLPTANLLPPFTDNGKSYTATQCGEADARAPLKQYTASQGPNCDQDRNLNSKSTYSHDNVIFTD